MSPQTESRISAPGALFAVIGCALLLSPFMSIAENRIVAGRGVQAWDLGPAAVTWPGLAALIAGLALALPARLPWGRLAGGLIGLGAVAWLVSRGAAVLLEDAGNYARTSPAAGAWGFLVLYLLVVADALSQLRPGPGLRAALLAGALALLAALLLSGAFSELSIALEYGSRQAAFGDAFLRHLKLAFGSLGAAAVIGFPLGLLCHRRAPLREAVLPVLSFMQTVPSLAMFGIMIPILAWVANTVPGARALGIAGIGFAPAFFALVIYSLLPVVANTVAGLRAVPPAAAEAARGMGLSAGQRLWQVEIPLGLPVLLSGLRIVLVQNIGLAVIAGLIGGGGFGSFVFQGLNQTATDLILLGALPTVLLALVAATAMDILVDLVKPGPGSAA